MARVPIKQRPTKTEYPVTEGKIEQFEKQTRDVISAPLRAIKALKPKKKAAK